MAPQNLTTELKRISRFSLHPFHRSRETLRENILRPAKSHDIKKVISMAIVPYSALQLCLAHILEITLGRSAARLMILNGKISQWLNKGDELLNWTFEGEFIEISYAKCEVCDTFDFVQDLVHGVGQDFVEVVGPLSALTTAYGRKDGEEREEDVIIKVDVNAASRCWIIEDTLIERCKHGHVRHIPLKYFVIGSEADFVVSESAGSRLAAYVEDWRRGTVAFIANE